MASDGHTLGRALGHHHRHEDEPGARARRSRSLRAAFAVTAAFTLVEGVAGILTGSLALLADAGHMLSDNVALSFALFAIWLAGRPATASRSFGFRRAEILAALANGVGLMAIAIWIVITAAGRLGDPPEIAAGPVLAVAVLGLAVNVAAAALLAGGRRDSLNVRAAFLHVLADLLGSLGVIVAALLVLIIGWQAADPIASLAIAALVLVSAVGILRESVRILLEATPAGIDSDEVGTRMAAIPGVTEVHDLHIWTITSGFHSLSAHLLVLPEEDCHARRRDAEALLVRDYGIAHTTLQVDHLGQRPAFVSLEEVSSPRAKDN